MYLDEILMILVCLVEICVCILVEIVMILTHSRRDYMRLKYSLVEILCETVKFYGGPLDFFAFLW